MGKRGTGNDFFLSTINQSTINQHETRFYILFILFVLLGDAGQWAVAAGGAGDGGVVCGVLPERVGDGGVAGLDAVAGGGVADTGGNVDGEGGDAGAAEFLAFFYQLLMNAISLYERLWTPLFFFRAGEAYGRRGVQRELEARRMEARQVVGALRRARRSWKEMWAQLAAAGEQITVQQEMIAGLEQEVWMGAERLAMAREQVASLDVLVGLMLEGPEGLELGRRYKDLRWQRLNREREEELEQKRQEEAAEQADPWERERVAGLTRLMGRIGDWAHSPGDPPVYVR